MKKFISIITLVTMLFSLFSTLLVVSAEDAYIGATRWDFIDGVDGVTGNSRVTPTASNGILNCAYTGVTSGNAGQVKLSNVVINSNVHKYLKVRAKLDSNAASLRLYAGSTIGNIAKTSFADPNGYNVYVYDISSLSGTYATVRIDILGENSTSVAGNVEIDWIILTNQEVEPALLSELQVGTLSVDVTTEGCSEIILNATNYSSLSTQSDFSLPTVCEETYAEGYDKVGTIAQVTDMNTYKILDVTATARDSSSVTVSRSYRYVVKQGETESGGITENVTPVSYMGDVRWDFIDGVDETTANSKVTLTSTNGILNCAYTGVTSGNAGQVKLSNVVINSNVHKYLKVRAKLDSNAASLRLYAGSTIGNIAKTSFADPNGYNVYVYDISSLSGTYETVRLDILGADGNSVSGNVEIDWIVLTLNKTDRLDILSEILVGTDNVDVTNSDYSPITVGKETYSSLVTQENFNLQAECEVMYLDGYTEKYTQAKVTDRVNYKILDITAVATDEEMNEHTSCYRVLVYPPVAYVGGLRWDFAFDTENVTGNTAMYFTHANGILNCTSTSDSSVGQIRLNNIEIDSSVHKYLKINANLSDSVGALRLVVRKDGANTVLETLNKVDGYNTYVFDINSIDSGTYEYFRIDLLKNGKAVKGTVSIDWILISANENNEPAVLSGLSVCGETANVSATDYSSIALGPDDYANLVGNEAFALPDSVIATYSNEYTEVKTSACVVDRSSHKVIDITTTATDGNGTQIVRSYRVIVKKIYTVTVNTNGIDKIQGITFVGETSVTADLGNATEGVFAVQLPAGTYAVDVLTANGYRLEVGSARELTVSDEANLEITITVVTSSTGTEMHSIIGKVGTDITEVNVTGNTNITVTPDENNYICALVEPGEYSITLKKGNTVTGEFTSTVNDHSVWVDFLENEIIAEYSVTTDDKYHTVNASVTNLGTNVIIIAGYDNDHCLKSVILDKTEAKFETSLGIDYFKCFIWNNMQDIVPQIPATTLDLTSGETSEAYYVAKSAYTILSEGTYRIYGTVNNSNSYDNYVCIYKNGEIISQRPCIAGEETIFEVTVQATKDDVIMIESYANILNPYIASDWDLGISVSDGVAIVSDETTISGTKYDIIRTETLSDSVSQDNVYIRIMGKEYAMTSDGDRYISPVAITRTMSKQPVSLRADFNDYIKERELSDSGYVTATRVASSSYPASGTETKIKVPVEEDGTIVISGLFNFINSVDGELIKVYKNDELIWSNRIGGEVSQRWDEEFDTKYFINQIDVATNVVEGDEIIFTFNRWRRNSNLEYIDISDIDIRYVSDFGLSKSTAWKLKNSAYFDVIKKIAYINGEKVENADIEYVNGEIVIGAELAELAFGYSGNDLSVAVIADSLGKTVVAVEDGVVIVHAGLPGMFTWNEISEIKTATVLN